MFSYCVVETADWNVSGSPGALWFRTRKFSVVLKFFVLHDISTDIYQFHGQQPLSIYQQYLLKLPFDTPILKLNLIFDESVRSILQVWPWPALCCLLIAVKVLDLTTYIIGIFDRAEIVKYWLLLMDIVS